MKKKIKNVLSWLARHNEFTFVIGLILLIWIFVPPILRIFDPQAGEFSIEILYVPLIAGVYFFIGLLFIWLYFKLVFPKGFNVLDNLFNNTKYYNSWENGRLVLRFFFLLVILYSACLIAVTGISAIM